MGKIIIGVTDGKKYDYYANWISDYPEVEIIRLGYRLNNFEDIKKCTGMFLTGGEDVHPRWYHKPEYHPLCQQDYMDEQRDEFEWKILEYTQQNKMPVLGVCRGLQIANVFFGGTLIPDIPTFGKFNHGKKGNGPRNHSIIIDKNSDFYALVGIEAGEINSMHHQSADRVANNLVASSFSPDGVIESLEWKNPTDQSYLSLVQWHPELMADQASPLVANIKKSFLEKAKNQ